MDEAGPQCQRIVGREQCGLEHGHDGEHLPYTPGEYLPPPMLHPLDVLLLTRTSAPRCPVCGVRVRGFEWEVTYAFRCFADGVWGEPELEYDWWFQPCGDQAREVVSADLLAFR